MQDLKVFITEKLDISRDYSIYNYRPKNKRELHDLINKLIKERGNEGNFNDIDTSLITDMSGLFFENVKFNGNISNWDTSRVTNMNSMFSGTKDFNQPIGDWDTSKVTDMMYMFYYAESFDQDISQWNVKKVKEYYNIFHHCPIKEEYMPEF